MHRPPPSLSPPAFVWAGAVTLEMVGRLQNSEIIKGLTEAFEEVRESPGLWGGGG